MVKPLCSFTVYQVVTLRDVGFLWSKKQKQLNLKSRSSAQYAYKRHLKNNSFEAQKSNGRPPKLSKKSKKKLVADVLKDPKTSLERIREAHNAFSCYETISRGTVRRLLKKNIAFFLRNAAKKSQFEEEKQVSVFVQNGVSICSRSRSRSGRMLF